MEEYYAKTLADCLVGHELGRHFNRFYGDFFGALSTTNIPFCPSGINVGVGMKTGPIEHCDSEYSISIGRIFTISQRGNGSNRRYEVFHDIFSILGVYSSDNMVNLAQSDRDISAIMQKSHVPYYLLCQFREFDATNSKAAKTPLVIIANTLPEDAEKLRKWEKSHRIRDILSS
ncbi:hypothetical protein HY638_02280 [Candidatus Woesearchaeota archaeon]|nr:hypothetical protein [Candidatus Woesearchaeota archaeon]